MDDLMKIAEGFGETIARVGRNAPLVSDAMALYRFVKDPAVHWGEKTMAVAALVYLVTPLDAIPDAIPVAGFLDDAGVLAAAAAYLDYRLQPYYY